MQKNKLEHLYKGKLCFRILKFMNTTLVFMEYDICFWTFDSPYIALHDISHVA